MPAPASASLRLFRSFLGDQSGTTAVEYGVVATLIGVTAIAALGLLGDELDNVFDCTENMLAGDTDCDDTNNMMTGGGGGP